MVDKSHPDTTSTEGLTMSNIDTLRSGILLMKKMRLLEAVLGSGTHGEGTEESSQDSVNVVIKPLSDKILQ